MYKLIVLDRNGNLYCEFLEEIAGNRCRPSMHVRERIPVTFIPDCPGKTCGVDEVLHRHIWEAFVLMDDLNVVRSLHQVTTGAWFGLLIEPAGLRLCGPLFPHIDFPLQKSEDSTNFLASLGLPEQDRGRLFSHFALISR